MGLSTGTVVVFKEACFASNPGKSKDFFTLGEYVIEKNTRGLVTTCEDDENYTIIVDQTLVKVDCRLEDYVHVCNSLEELNKHVHNGKLKLAFPPIMSTPIQANARKLKTKWSVETAEDLKAFYGDLNINTKAP